MTYNKYRVSVKGDRTVDGIVFASKREAVYYKELKLRKAAGEIIDFELQPKFSLLSTFKKNGKTIRGIKYVADFKIIYPDSKKIEIIDCKGFKTREYKLKKKLFEFQYPHLTIKEV